MGVGVRLPALSTRHTHALQFACERERDSVLFNPSFMFGCWHDFEGRWASPPGCHVRAATHVHVQSALLDAIAETRRAGGRNVDHHHNHHGSGGGSKAAARNSAASGGSAVQGLWAAGNGVRGDSRIVARGAEVLARILDPPQVRFDNMNTDAV